MLWYVLRRRRKVREFTAEHAKAQAEIDAYAAAAERALDAAPDQVDWAELRGLYSATIDYWGISRFDERDSVEGAKTAADVTTALLIRDFPLLETQLSAAAYYRNIPEELDPDKAERSMQRFETLARFIRDSAGEGKDGPIYKVLSIEEEYILMDWMGLKPTSPDTQLMQSLAQINGIICDRFELGDKIITFDISAFYELGALHMMLKAEQAGRER